MSRRVSKPQPQPGIYDGLMFISCGALIAGIVFLVLHLNEYNWQIAAG